VPFAKRKPKPLASSPDSKLPPRIEIVANPAKQKPHPAVSHFLGLPHAEREKLIKTLPLEQKVKLFKELQKIDAGPLTPEEAKIQEKGEIGVKRLEARLRLEAVELKEKLEQASEILEKGNKNLLRAYRERIRLSPGLTEQEKAVRIRMLEKIVEAQTRLAKRVMPHQVPLPKDPADLDQLKETLLALRHLEQAPKVEIKKKWHID